VVPLPVRETIRAVGSLAANESVNVVAELSRRLVDVRVAEGASVAAGDVLFKLDDSDLRARLAELEVRRRLAARMEERQRALLAEDAKALSQQSYDEAVGAVRAADAEIASLRVTLAKTEIRAPFRGRTGIRRVSEGAWVTPETVLTTLHDASRVKIDFPLPERHASLVLPGRTFEFRIAGHADRFAGKVLAIEPAIDARTRSLLVRGIADNPGEALHPGAFVDVEMTLEESGRGVVVPAQAVIPSVSGHAVYVVRDGRAELRDVEIGVRTPDQLQVLSGVALGDVVVTSNLLRMRPGARVEVIEQAAAKERS
jgi:membrane fusion protein (multidrug efflux system)